MKKGAKPKKTPVVSERKSQADHGFDLPGDMAAVPGEDEYLMGDENIEYMSDEELLGLDDNFSEEMDLDEDY